MKHLFFATLIISLSLITPAYISFAVCIAYMLFTGTSPVYLLVLGIFLDTVYGHRLDVFGYLIPLYTLCAMVGFFALSTLTKRLSYIS